MLKVESDHWRPSCMPYGTGGEICFRVVPVVGYCRTTFCTCNSVRKITDDPSTQRFGRRGLILCFVTLHRAFENVQKLTGACVC